MAPPRKFKDPLALPPPIAPTLPVVAESQPEPLARELLKAGWFEISKRSLAWLQGVNPETGQPRLEELLESSKLTGITAFVKAATDTTVLLEGKPVESVSQDQQVQLDQIGQLLQETLTKRGVVTLTERKAQIQLPPKGKK